MPRRSRSFALRSSNSLGGMWIRKRERDRPSGTAPTHRMRRSFRGSAVPLGCGSPQTSPSAHNNLVCMLSSFCINEARVAAVIIGSTKHDGAVPRSASTRPASLPSSSAQQNMMGRCFANSLEELGETKTTRRVGVGILVGQPSGHVFAHGVDRRSTNATCPARSSKI